MGTLEINRVNGDFGFEAKYINGNLLLTDVSDETEGKNSAISPMQSLLMTLGGCSGID